MCYSNSHGKESPTDFLIRSLERIENVEDVILVFRYKDSDGTDCVDWLANDVPFWKILGMVEFAKHSMYETSEGKDD